MEQACEADNLARENLQPAIHKLKMLPEVVALLNRNTVQHSIVDPDTNFLQSVKFFLEPLNDGSLPAYNIQRDLFSALTRLPIEKEALLSSGIGKVVLYYTKSKKPEIGIKRTAERLLGEWSRPILKRSDDYKKRKVITKEFDHQYVYSLSPLDISNKHPEPLNLRFVLLEFHRRRCHHHNVQASHSGTLNENVSSPSPSEATELGWKLPTLVILSHHEAISILARAWILLRDRLVQVAWKHSGK